MRNSDWQRQYEMNCFATSPFWKLGSINYTSTNAYILNDHVLKRVTQVIRETEQFLKYRLELERGQEEGLCKRMCQNVAF